MQAEINPQPLFPLHRQQQRPDTVITDGSKTMILELINCAHQFS